MFNLLRKQEKDLVKREYKMRLGAVFLSFLFFSAIAGTFMVLPSYFISKEKEASLQIILDALKKASLSPEGGDEGADLRFSKEKMAVLKEGSEKKDVYEIISRIVKEKPADVSISRFSLSRNGSEGTIYVSGLSAGRSELVSFGNRLSQTGLFSKVDLPVSNFAKETSINFSLSVSGDF